MDKGSQVLLRNGAEMLEAEITSVIPAAHGDPTLYTVRVASGASKTVPESALVEILSQDECDAIGADGRDGRGWITAENLTAEESKRLAAFRG